MADFVNTIDLLGDEEVTKRLIEGTITEFNDDVIKTVGQYAFYYCTALKSVDLPNVTKLSGYDFNNCTNLATIILRSETLCTMNGTPTLAGTPFASSDTVGTLVVPRALTTEYLNATNWSMFFDAYDNNRVLALEDYTVDGTITGEIDWDKLNGGN